MQACSHARNGGRLGMIPTEYGPQVRRSSHLVRLATLCSARISYGVVLLVRAKAAGLVNVLLVLFPWLAHNGWLQSLESTDGGAHRARMT